MAQAAKTNTTLRLVPRSDFGDLEDKFHSAVCMARIASSLLENEMADRADHMTITGKPNHYFLREDDVEAMFFAVYETQKMITDLRDKYLDVLRLQH